MNKDLSPDLNNGITRAIFIFGGTTPELRDKLIIYVNGAEIELKDSLTACSDADWRKKELIKPQFRKKRWDLSDARIDLAK